ncbi:DUF1080 domain-containing protein [Ktedonosporobacter rubrisoli]|uniref:DUF1080 domain-containing protein n=1 Tax=Ktedonosporobacter rubrisoli TaxID=2509675 RepID=A0A4P6JTX0_KTERU|nr:family 16 glycoside hydrolase [Ktedonosporobacter rubrisoli]QBD78732.1 DUF1080 domain-containing protein [Ktedonosporobacter rubrisoli]
MQPTDRQPTGFLKQFKHLPPRKVSWLIGLVALLLIASIELLNFVQLDGTATAQIKTEAATRVKTISTAFVASHSKRDKATAVAMAAVTATTMAQATATATITDATATVAASGNPFPPHNGTLQLDDTLHNNSSNAWTDGDNANAACHFQSGAYNVIENSSVLTNACYANASSFSNFVFDVQMKILKGQGGGVVFRADPASGKAYLFRIDQDGSYSLLIYTSDKDSQLLTYSTLSAFRADQNNELTVIAQGDKLDIYINKQHVLGLSNGTYKQGNIGVTATGGPTDVAYTSARVWTL